MLKRKNRSSRRFNMTLNGAALALGALAGMAATSSQAETRDQAETAVGTAEGTAVAASASSGSCVGNSSKSASYCSEWKDGSTCIAKGCTWEQPQG